MIDTTQITKEKKMGFKTITDLSAERTISLGGVNKKTGKKNPTSVEGFYLGKREVEDKKKKSGTSYIYFFQTAEGNLGVWGKTDLDRKMNQVPVGVMTRVTQSGMAATQNGDMYKFTVEIDDSNSIEVTGSLNEDTGNDNEEDDEQQDDDQDDIPENYGRAKSYAQEEAQQNAALAAAERKNKVAALLKRK